MAGFLYCPISFAARKGFLEIVEILLENGSDINHQDRVNTLFVIVWIPLLNNSTS